MIEIAFWCGACVGVIIAIAVMCIIYHEFM